MRNIQGRVGALAMACAGLLLAGCQVAQYNSISPQTHFDYPNSNVTPVGPVRVKMAGPSSIISPPDIICSDTDIQLYDAALTKVSGANLITDYTKQYKIYGCWIFYWSTLELEGTAVKMQVGKQDIGH